MTIWQLQVFAAVVEHGSLQNAATALHRSSPALSMSVFKLEEELGFKLFKRDAYRLALTDSGRQFARHSYEVLRQYDRLTSLCKMMRDGAEAHLEIAFDSTCNPDILTPALQVLHKKYPGTEYRVSGYSQLHALKLVQQNEVPLALTPWLAVFQQRADFESLLVADFELSVVIAAELVPEGGLNRREQLSEIPYVLPRAMDMGIDPEQIYRVGGSARTRVNDVHTLIRLIKGGLGWGVVPRQLVAAEVSSGELIELTISGFLDRVRAEVRLVKLARTVLDPAAQTVWDYFIDGGTPRASRY